MRAVQRWILQNQWTMLIGTGSLAVISGFIGFMTARPELSATDALYLTMQLFTLESGASVPNPPLILGLARFLAPVSLGYAAILAFLTLLKDQIRLLALRFMRRHAVFCRLDEMSLIVIREFIRRGRRVVVIDPDEEHPLASDCRNLGATLLAGDFKNPETLQLARVTAAEYVLAVSDDDGANLDAMVKSYDLLKDGCHAGENAVRCFAKIDDFRLRSLFWKHPIGTAHHDRFEIDIFSFHDLAARDALERFPLDEKADGSPARGAHLAVVGFAGLGEALVLQAIRTGHFADGELLFITVLDADAERLQELFRQKYPRLEEVVHLQFLAISLADPVFSSGSWLSENANPDAACTVAICADDDITGFARALDLIEQSRGRSLRVLLRIQSNEGLAALLNNPHDPAFHGILQPFAVPADLCSWEHIVHTRLDRLAMALHEDYRRERTAAGDDPSTNPALVPWNRLSEPFKMANRHQADHIGAKLRAVGLRLESGTPGGPEFQFSPEQVETLSRMEHRRWLADRILSGWQPGPMNKEKRISPYLVPWNSLPGEMQEFNRVSIRRLPQILRQNGYRIVCRREISS